MVSDVILYKNFNTPYDVCTSEVCIPSSVQKTWEEAVARMWAIRKSPKPKYPILKITVKNPCEYFDIIQTCIKRTWYRGRKKPRSFASRLLESLGCNVAWSRRHNDDLYYIHVHYDIFIFSCFWSHLYVWLFDKKWQFFEKHKSCWK